MFDFGFIVLIVVVFIDILYIVVRRRAFLKDEGKHGPIIKIISECFCMFLVYAFLLVLIYRIWLNYGILYGKAVCDLNIALLFLTLFFELLFSLRQKYYNKKYEELKEEIEIIRGFVYTAYFLLYFVVVFGTNPVSKWY